MSRLSAPRLVDALLVALAGGQLLELVIARRDDAAVSVVVLMVLGPTALLSRRRVPLPSVLVSVGALAALIQLVPATLSTTFLTLLFAVGVFGALPVRAAVAGLAGALGIGVEGAWLDRYGGGAGDFAMSAAIMLGVWGCGLLLARGARRAAADAVRLADAERARALAIHDERSRMTRELHDVVAHGLTVLVVQTVAAQEDLEHDAPVETLRSRLAATEEVARESLHELRTLLGILGTTGEGIGRSTGTDGIRALVERLRATGLDVTLDVDEQHPADPALELAMYRVVQEALTNAYKHGVGGAAVSLSTRRDGVELVVTNEVRADASPVGSGVAPGSGRGLAGLRERVELHHGTLEIGSSGGVFRVHCVLPAPRVAQAAGTER